MIKDSTSNAQVKLPVYFQDKDNRYVVWRISKRKLKLIVFKTQIISNNMEKLPDLKELPENMSEIKEDRSEISLQDLIDNFYT